MDFVNVLLGRYTPSVFVRDGTDVEPAEELERRVALDEGNSVTGGNDVELLVDFLESETG